jgi:hypothetical protein
MHLFCGNEDGKILHYIDIENNLFDGGTFHRLDDVETWHATSLQTVSEGSFTAVAVADFNGDGLLDMVVGNHRGGLTIFFGTDKIPVKIVDSAETRLTASLRIYPNPVTDELRIINYEWKSGDIVEIFDLSGRRAYLKQINSSFFIFHSSFSIDVSHLTNGVYILKIGNQVAKFVKN